MSTQPGLLARTQLVNPFRRVLCAVNGTQGSDEAARQALALMNPEGTITFLAIADERSEQTALLEIDAQAAVESARGLARTTGATAEAMVISSDKPPRALTDAAHEFDLLVVGGPARSRAAGIVLGSTASFAIHTSPVPVLIARLQDAGEFPGTILAATAGTQDDATCATAATIAAAHGQTVVLAHVGRTRDAALRHALAEQGTRVIEITGREPVVLVSDGDPADRLSAMAADASAGLVVAGSRNRHGIAALASVSERVAHRARCSVLVLRHD